MTETTDHTDRHLLRKSEAAKLLAMSESTLEKLTCRKLIPHVKIGRTVRYDTADLWPWLAAKKVGMTPSAACPSC